MVTSYYTVTGKVATASLFMFDSMLAAIKSFIQAPKKTNAVYVEGVVQRARR